MKSDRSTSGPETSHFEARRRFLKDCGRYAVATPPAITLLLSTAGPNYAMAASGRSSLLSERDDDHRRGRNAHIETQSLDDHHHGHGR